MKICVHGLWHLGSVTAAALSAIGHEVVGLELNSGIFAGLMRAQAPIFEPGLDELLSKCIESTRLRFINSPADIPIDIQLHWVTFDTPVSDDDVADVEVVITQVIAVLPYLPDRCTVLVSSQLPVGSVRLLEVAADNLYPAKYLSFAVLPENLRLGKALEVFLKPDRVVVGIRNKRDQELVAQALKPIGAHIEWMSVESAEMTKHAINAFLASSIVFANEIATLCELEGANAKEVERGLKSESRIGPKAYLGPGGPFAGGTLARDLEFLESTSQRHDLPIPMLKSIKISNDTHKNWVHRRLLTLIPVLKDVRVTVWGLTYKPGTDTLRRSYSVELCNWLLSQGAKLSFHDPVVKVMPCEWLDRVARSDDPLQALIGSRILIIGTEWPTYRDVAATGAVAVAPGLIVFDSKRFLTGWADTPGLTYIAVGTPAGRIQL